MDIKSFTKIGKKPLVDHHGASAMYQVWWQEDSAGAVFNAKKPKDMKTFKEAASWMHSERLFSAYPQLINSIMEELYRSDGKPRRKIGKIGWDAIKGTVSKRHLIADLLKGGRSLVW